MGGGAEGRRAKGKEAERRGAEGREAEGRRAEGRQSWTICRGPPSLRGTALCPPLAAPWQPPGPSRGGTHWGCSPAVRPAPPARPRRPQLCPRCHVMSCHVMSCHAGPSSAHDHIRGCPDGGPDGGPEWQGRAWAGQGMGRAGHGQGRAQMGLLLRGPHPTPPHPIAPHMYILTLAALGAPCCGSTDGG